MDMINPMCRACEHLDDKEMYVCLTCKHGSHFEQATDNRQTNREKLSRLPLDELLGKISDGTNECIPYALGDAEYFRTADCGRSDGESQIEHCRKCIIKWLDEKENGK